MPEVQNIVSQVELATGMPWWGVLLIAGLAVAVLVLALCLGRANRRVRTAQGGVAIPKAPAAADAGEEAEESAGEAEEPAAGEDEEPREDAPEQEAEDPDAPEGQTAEPAEEEPEVSVPPEAPQAPEPPESADDTPAEPSDEAEALESSETEPEPEEIPAVELVEEEPSPVFNLEDDEILKATAGNHSRMGQSAFGIDFGFLEEYEEEYDRALEEFRRLRGKNE